MRHKITFKKFSKQSTKQWTASLILVLMLASLPGCGKSQEKASVNAKGHYEGGEFWADSIIIYHFV